MTKTPDELLKSSTEAKLLPVDGGECASQKVPTREEMMQELREMRASGTFIDWADREPSDWQKKLPGCSDEEL